MLFLFAIIFFVFGLIIGSFLNVVIFRFNSGKTLGGRSKCLSCRQTLSWYELIPVFSFLGLRGRCKNCKTKISIQYPLVELAAGLIFTALFLKLQNVLFADTFSFSIAYFYYAFSFSLLLVVAVYDLRHKIIPDRLVFIFGLFAFLGLFFFNSNLSVFYPHWPSIWNFLAGPLLASPFFFFWLVSGGRWMGLGDAKLAFGLGWLLGLSLSLSALVLAFWIGAVVGLLLIFFSPKYGLKSEIPFAPYLVLGTLLAFLFNLHLFLFF